MSVIANIDSLPVKVFLLDPLDYSLIHIGLHPCQLTNTMMNLLHTGWWLNHVGMAEWQISILFLTLQEVLANPSTQNRK